jgi:hypothetical protein
MVKLVAFVYDGTNTIKSIGVAGQRTKYVQRPTRKGASPRVMNLPICKSHDSSTKTLPVELRSFDAGNPEGKPLEIVRACVLCWSVVEAP